MLSFQIFLEKSWVFFGKDPDPDPDPGFYFSSDPDPYKKNPGSETLIFNYVAFFQIRS